MLSVPLRAVPAQVSNIVLGGQQAVLTVQQKNTGLFINVEIGIREIVGVVLCENLNRIVRDSYLGFRGDLVFFDTAGAGADPYFTGLGSRFILVYLTQEDLATFAALA